MNSDPTITIALDWAANTNHTGLLVALHRGFFADAGLLVRILPAERARGVTELVSAGDADMAFAFAGTVIEQRMAGTPLVAVAAVAQHNVSSLVALAGSGITRPSDFAGKRYASFGHPQFERGVIQRMMTTDGATTTDFTLTAERFASVELLTSGAYDFLWVYDGVELVEAATQGIYLVSFAPGNYGVPDYYAPVIFAHDRLLADSVSREAGRRVITAIQRGYQVAIAQPDAVLADIAATAPALGGWLFATEEITRASQQYQSANYAPQSAAHWGEQTLPLWVDFARFLTQIGVIATMPETDYPHCFTNDLLITSDDVVL